MKKRTMRLGCILLSTALLGTAALTGCRQMKKNTTDTKKTESSSTKESAKEKKGPEIDGLTYESTMDLEYAEGFQVYYYKDGYKISKTVQNFWSFRRTRMCRMELMRIT